MTSDDRSGYVLGDSRSELERLERQARFYAPGTEALLKVAGIAPGQRVLDIGSGAGDVSMLLANMVGPGGKVLGVERSPQAVETARMRAAARGLSQCRFEVAEIDAFETDERFDAVAGRLILMYMPDPAATLRGLLHFLAPGGVIAFQELYFSGARGYPQSALMDTCERAIRAAFAHVRGDLDMGMRMFETFCKAGLPDPKLLNWAPAVTRAEPEGYYIMASLMRTLTPMLVQAGLMREDEIGIDTLERRLIEEVSDKGHIYIWSPLVGAWSRKP